MQHLRLIFVSFLILISLALPASAKRVAFVLGNDVAGVGALSDRAEQVAKQLKRFGFDVVFASNAGSSDLDKMIGEFRTGMQGAEISLFYYARAAAYDQKRNVSYLTSSDWKPGADVSESLQLQALIDEMAMASHSNVVILDAVAPEDRADTGLASGLVRLKGKEGLSLAYSLTSPDHLVQQGPTLTSALINQLKRPSIKLASLATNLRDDTFAESDGLQVPWIAGSLSDNLVLDIARLDNGDARTSQADGEAQELIARIREKLTGSDDSLRKLDEQVVNLCLGGDASKSAMSQEERVKLALAMPPDNKSGEIGSAGLYQASTAAITLSAADVCPFSAAFNLPEPSCKGGRLRSGKCVCSSVAQVAYRIDDGFECRTSAGKSPNTPPKAAKKKAPPTTQARNFNMGTGNF